MSRPRFEMRFETNWKILVLVALLLPLLLCLGFWQLERAEEKRDLQGALAARQLEVPAVIAELGDKGADALAFRAVMLEGKFSSEYTVMLDNRIRQGRPGYEILQLFEDHSGTAVLVNRGWVEAPLKRDEFARALSDVPSLIGSRRLRGSVYVPAGDPVLLKHDELQAAWPMRVQCIFFAFVRQTTRPANVPRNHRLVQSF